MATGLDGWGGGGEGEAPAWPELGAGDFMVSKNGPGSSPQGTCRPAGKADVK